VYASVLVGKYAYTLCISYLTFDSQPIVCLWTWHTIESATLVHYEIAAELLNTLSKGILTKLQVKKMQNRFIPIRCTLKNETKDFWIYRLNPIKALWHLLALNLTGFILKVKKPWQIMVYSLTTLKEFIHYIYFTYSELLK